MVALIVLLSPGAWVQDGQAKDRTSAQADGCPIGVYLTSLRDLVTLFVLGASVQVINEILILLAATSG